MSQQDIAKLIKDCIEAADAKDRTATARIAASLRQQLKAAAEPPPDIACVKLVKAIRSLRLFEDLAATADVLVSLGAKLPIVRRYMAQGLVDSGRIEAGIAVAQQLAPMIAAMIDRIPTAERTGQDYDTLVDEHSDTLALVGRANKQIYVDLRPSGRTSRREAALRQAIRHYYDAFKVARDVQKDFAGSNVMALLDLAARDGIDVKGMPSVREMADAVEKAASLDIKRQHTDAWAASSMAEAHLARGELEKAAEWYGIYAYHPKVDAFMLGGTIRQLEQIWGLKAGTQQADQILAALKARLLQLDGGTVELSVEERRSLGSEEAGRIGELSQRVLAGREHYREQRVDETEIPTPKANLEKVVTPTGGFADFRMMLLAVRRGQSVARICSGPGVTVGTGFLVRGSDICPHLSDEPLILTNSHVVSKHGSAAAGSAPISPGAARIYFDIDAIEGQDRGYRCELVWESPVDELDATLLRPIPSSVPHPPLHIAPADVVLVPERGAVDAAPPTRLLIIGHPHGGALKISIEHSQKSTLLEIGTKPPAEHVFLHYQTPTEPGMSGSPVLHEETGALVGLHHAGPTELAPEIPRLNGQKGGIRANEGVLIHSITRAFTRSRTGAASAAVATPGAKAVALPLQAQASGPMPEAVSSSAPPRIPYAELVARLADTSIDNKSLAPYFVALPQASGPYAPAFAVNPGLVDLGGAAVDASSLAGLMNRFCSLDRRARSRSRLKSGGDGLRFVCEGDSWFEYPLLVDDTIDHLEKSFPVYCLAAASDTLETMTSEANFRDELLPAIQEVRPHGFLLSAGGSEILGAGLRDSITPYDKRLRPDQYLNEVFTQRILALQGRLARAFSRLQQAAPQMSIFTHGYDLRPPQRSGQWLAATFSELGIDDLELRRDIMARILGRIAGMHHALERGHPGLVHFVDVRGAVPGSMWLDELHPTSAGFALVADRFKMRIVEVLAPRVKAG